MPGVGLELTLSIEVDRLANVVGALDFREPLKVAGIMLASEAKMSFVNQASPDGSPWAPFKRTPSARRGGKSAKLLRDTGLLMASYQGGQGHAENVTALSMEWGSSLDRAGWHNSGTRTIPARPQAGFTPLIAQDIGDMVSEWLEKQLAGK